MKVVTEILQDLEILKRLLKHNANLKIRINYYLTLYIGFEITSGPLGPLVYFMSYYVFDALHQ